MMTRWKMSLMSVVCALLVGCGTTTPVKTVQRATIHLTIKWPKATRAIRLRTTRAIKSRAMYAVRPRATRDIDPSADTIILTVSSAGAVVDTETITKPADGSASQVMVSAPVQKTRIGAVAYNSADPNTILDQGSAPSDGGSYLSLAPGASNMVDIVLNPLVNSLPFVYINPVTGSETIRNAVTAIYAREYVYATTYNASKHILYISGRNPDLDENIQFRLVAIDTLTGDTLSNISLSQPVSYLGYDSVNQILFGWVNGTNPIQFCHIDPNLGTVTIKSQIAGFYDPISIPNSTESTAFDQDNHLLYIVGPTENVIGQSLNDKLVTIDTLTGDTLSTVILSQPVTNIGYDSVKQILFGFTSYPTGPVNVEFSYVDPMTGSITVKSQLTAIYNRDYIFATVYDQANHLLYLSGSNPNYTDMTAWRMITIDILTGNTLSDAGLSKPANHIGYDPTNKILFGFFGE